MYEGYRQTNKTRGWTPLPPDDSYNTGATHSVAR